MGQMIRRLADTAIGAYQRYISADFNGARNARCLYSPSCSEYVREAIARRGVRRGIAEGLFRLLRCNRAVQDRQRDAFLAYLADTPLPSKDLRASPEFHPLLEKLGDQARRDPASALRELDTLPLTVADPVTSTDTTSCWSRWTGILPVTPDGSPRFLMELPLPPIPVPPPSWGRQGAGVLAGVVTAFLAGSGGAVVGLVAGGVAGAVLAAVTAAGKLDRLNDRLAARYSPDSVHGIVQLAQPVGGVARQTRERILARLGTPRLALAAAALIGVPVGLMIGAIGGMDGGARMAGTMGFYLGRNWVWSRLAPEKSPDPGAAPRGASETRS